MPSFVADLSQSTERGTSRRKTGARHLYPLFVRLHRGGIGYPATAIFMALAMIAKSSGSI
jgi:hypothetical protein